MSLMSLRNSSTNGVRKWKAGITQVLRKYPEDLPRGNSTTSRASYLKETYTRVKTLFQSKKLPKDVNPLGVFACNEMNLADIKVYGFDYDYTLAHYKPSMEHLLYKLGTKTLIEKYKYPPEISKLQYQPNFAVRGLHYDIEKGLLLKLDSFLQIQFGAVYRGLKSVPTDEVLKIYKNKIIPIAYVEGDPRLQKASRAKMVHLADLFSVPEMGLLCNVADYFIKNNIHYSPEILFLDVKNSVRSSHTIMHNIVVNNLEEYIRPNKNLRKYFQMLQDHHKQVFLVTNSPFHFVNAGMGLLMGHDWRDFFDVVIVNAKKPKFFTEKSRPIRVFDKNANSHIWDKVTSLKKGVIYYEGTVNQLQELTGWRGHQVLYFGDHPYYDLADVTLEHGWCTGAIINELTHEINTLNIESFKVNANWLQMLTTLIEDHQDYLHPEDLKVIDEWMAERDYLRNETKRVFNPQFGSVFRTYHNPTYFSRRLFRFADVYTSNISNLLNYPMTYTFYPRRGALPHEYGSYFV